jgi:hypothetical protein
LSEPFNLPVIYHGTQLEFKARFEPFGYTHHIAVLIDDTTFTFEPDEEGGYRGYGDQPGKAALLQAVAEKLVKLGA